MRNLTSEEELQISNINKELDSQGATSVQVKDGTVFFFTREMVTHLYEKLQADPKVEVLQLFLCSDPKKVASTRNQNRN